MTETSPPVRRFRESVFWRGVVVLIAWYVAATLLVGVVLLSTPDSKAPGDNTCDGLGFGCTPTPRDGLLILALYGSPLLCVAIAISFVVLPILIHMRVRSWMVLGTISAVIGVGTTACLTAGYIAIHG